MITLQPESLITSAMLADRIDHTKLTFGPEESAPEVQEAAIRHLCAEAIENRFAAVCVRPAYVSLCKAVLAGSAVKVATVIGFPQTKVTLANEQAHPTVGTISLEEKLAEAGQAVADRVDELDLVMNVAQFKTDIREKTTRTLAEFQTIQRAAGPCHVKVIIETDLLTPEEIRQACWWCAEAGVAMVKTSTGMIEGGQGGTVTVVDKIQQALADYRNHHPQGAALGIKASGGIKTLSHAVELLRRGVSRLGTSSGVSLIQESKAVQNA